MTTMFAREWVKARTEKVTAPLRSQTKEDSTLSASRDLVRYFLRNIRDSQTAKQCLPTLHSKANILNKILVCTILRSDARVSPATCFENISLTLQYKISASPNTRVSNLNAKRITSESNLRYLVPSSYKTFVPSVSFANYFQSIIILIASPIVSTETKKEYLSNIAWN